MTIMEQKTLSEITAADIQGLIGRSENQHLEFKSQEIDGDKFAKVISGFANAEGGYIVIGANEGEQGTCDGFVSIPDIGVHHQKVQQSNRNYIDEPVQDIKTKDIKLPGGENVFVVYVPESPRKPHAIRKQGEQLLQFWIRSGSHTVEMKLNEIRNAFLKSAGVLDILAGSDTTHDAVDHLSDLEQEILLLAADNQGELYRMSVNEIGDWLRVGRKNYEESGNPAVRVEAIEALKRLQSLGLVRPESGLLFTLTGEGFRKAKELKENQN